MTRSAAIALAALLLAGAPPAMAQFRGTPMVVPAAPGADLLTGRFSGAAVQGELATVDRATGAAQLRLHGALLAPLTYAGVLPAGTPVSAGRTRANGADLLSEVAYPQGAGVVVRYGAALGSPVSRPGGPAGPVSFVRALPHEGDLLAFTNPDVGSGAGFLEIWDFDTSALGGNALAHSWRADGLAPLEATEHVVAGLRLSPAALALGVEDLALPTQGGVFLLAHRPTTADLRYAAPPATPWELRLAEVRVGGASALERPPWLPPSIARKGDALGAAALDLDLDGSPDLLFSYGSALEVPDGQGGLVTNHLVAVQGTGDPLGLATGAWQDVTGDPRLALRDPVTLRQVELAGEPAVALWDRGRDEVVVLRVEAGALRVWRGDAAGRRVHDLRVADVAGSPAPDLVAGAEDVLVYPDLADASPTLAWAPGSGGPAIRGRDLPLSVTAGDADGAVAVEWFVGDAYGAPVQTASVAAGAQATLPFVRSGALLCEPPPQALDVTVRATDALGVFAELAAHLEVLYPAPALSLAAASGSRLALPPGGTSAVLEGVSEAGCAPPTFTWGGTLLDVAPAVPEPGTPTTSRRRVDLPEATYPALLAGADPTVTLVAQDGAATSLPAALALDLDASGLVEVVHSADVPALAPGELAVLRTVVRSRLAIPLPAVRVADLLGGLLPAGAPRVTGAAVVATPRQGAEVVLDALPGGGAEVVIELPVRSTGDRGRSAVEVRSSGGHLLGAPAASAGEDAPLPGCGCGGAASGEALLALLLLALLRRRARAT